MTTKFTIDAANLPHAPLLAEIHAASFGGECWSVEQIQGSLALATTRAWIAQDQGTPAGFILCQIAQRQMEILTLCVKPEHRQQGIGGALLRQAMDFLEAEGGRKLLLEVAADNHAARRIYEDHGMKITGTRKNYYKRGAVTVDAVMYGIKLVP